VDIQGHFETSVVGRGNIVVVEYSVMSSIEAMLIVPAIDKVNTM
jgi:hypothetical protein